MYPNSNTVSYIKNFCKAIQSKGTKLEKVFLFGSHASNSARVDSDIDVALFSNEFIGFLPHDSLKFKNEIFDFYEIEPHTYSWVNIENDEFVQNEIIAKGIEIRIDE